MADPETELDSQRAANQHLVAIKGDMIAIFRPRLRYTPDQALNLAAWLIILSGSEFENFVDLFNEVQNT